LSKPPDNLAQTLELKDGSRLLVRAIRADDAPRLQALHSRLSLESRYMRFFSARADLPSDQAHRLAQVDYQTRMAFVATRLQDGEEQVIGVARYAVSDPNKPNEAEAAIVVEDSYQERGIGTILLSRLVDYARLHGIQYFCANVDSMNAKMLRMIQRIKLPTEMKMDDGVWDIRIRIAT
jgi:acetyltransferase